MSPALAGRFPTIAPPAKPAVPFCMCKNFHNTNVLFSPRLGGSETVLSEEERGLFSFLSLSLWGVEEKGG